MLVAISSIRTRRIDVSLCCMVGAFDAGLRFNDWLGASGLRNVFRRRSASDSLRARVGGHRHSVGCTGGSGGRDGGSRPFPTGVHGTDDLCGTIGRDSSGQSSQAEDQRLHEHPGSCFSMST